MLSILFQIFIISFLLNFLWEVVHSQFYETCLKLSLKKFIPLIIKASLSDAFWIFVFFVTSVLLFGNLYVLESSYQILFFVAISFMGAFLGEKVALKQKKWEYAKTMPQIFGVGLTPLLQLTVTGILTFLYIFLI